MQESALQLCRMAMARFPVWCIMFLCVATFYSVEGDIEVFVNRMLLQDSADWSSSREHRLQYWFAAGDVVDVMCRGWRVYPLRLSLDYQFDDETIGGNGRYTSERASDVLGLRTRLCAAHNGSSVTCSKHNTSIIYTITVQLLMRASFDGVPDLKINALSMRYQQESDPVTDSYLVKYVFADDKSVTLECGTNLNDVVVQAFKDNNPLPDTKVAGGRKELGSSLTYVARHNVTVLRNVTIQFLKYLINDASPLSINTSDRVLELYDLHGDRAVHYNYDEGETVTLNCSTLPELIFKYSYILAFGETEEYTKSYVVQKIKLTPDYHIKTMECRLLDKYFEVARIRVTFRFRDRVRAGTHGAHVPISSDFGVGVGAMVGGAVACLACGVALTLGATAAWRRCRRWRRNSRATDGFEMVRIQPGQLPQPAIEANYVHAHNSGSYEEIPGAAHRSGKVQQDEHPGTQNTLYYWLSSSSSSSEGGDEIG